MYRNILKRVVTERALTSILLFFFSSSSSKNFNIFIYPFYHTSSLPFLFFNRRPGDAGRCRVCVKAMKPDEYFKECTECGLKVCDDCASYSSHSDGNEVCIFFIYSTFFYAFIIIPTQSYLHPVSHWISLYAMLYIFSWYKNSQIVISTFVLSTDHHHPLIL